MSSPKNKKRIILNARGFKHDILLSSLTKLPNSRLGKLKTCLDESSDSFNQVESLCDDYDLNKMEFYFNRDPFILNSILNYFSSGKLHIDDSICSMLIQDELKYWLMDEKLIFNCCEWKYIDKKDDIERDINREKYILKHYFYNEKFNNFYLPKLREKMYYLFERPSSSYLGRTIFAFNLITILLTTSICIIRTLPELRKNSDFLHSKRLIDTSNSTMSTKQIDYQDRIDDIFDKIQLGCTIFFIIEILIRLISSPNFIQFLKSPLNILDITLAVIDLIYYSIYGVDKSVLNAVKIIRIFLIFKLFRFSKSLRILIYVLRKSYKELSSLFIYVMIMVVIFSSFIFLAEQIEDKNTRFTSIPASFWWSIITVTTVGYGDYAPVTVFGKIIGGISAIFGSIFVALPLGMLAGIFTKFYQNEKRNKKIISKHKKLIAINQNSQSYLDGLAF